MSIYVDRIKTMINCLPESDRELATSLLNSRKFTDLQDLVISDIRKARKYRNKTENNPFSNIVIEDLEVLKSEIEYYMCLSDVVVDSDYDLEEEVFY